MNRSPHVVSSLSQNDDTSGADVSGTAKRRLLSARGEPFLFADWQRVVFLHYVISPEVLRPHVPEPFELELHEGRACVSLVALTMRRFRPCRPGSLAAWPLRPLARQCFLNVRTYVRWGEEAGALFLWGWLSKPFGVGLPLGGLGLPCRFGSLEYEDSDAAGRVRGVVNVGGKATGIRTANIEQRTLNMEHRTSNAESFRYQGLVENGEEFQPCEPGSLAEFAMERYSGFFCWGTRRMIFRAWHPPWLQKPLEVTVEDDGLLRGKFPWFKEARLAAANFAPGFERVWLGKAHRLEKIGARRGRGGRVLSAFYEMP